MNDKQDLITKAQDAEERLKAATREANGLTGDLRGMIKEARTLVKDLVETVIRDEVTKQLGVMTGEVQKATDQATDAVFARFDKLTATMLGETKTRRDKGDPSIPELIERFAEINALKDKEGGSSDEALHAQDEA